MHEIIFTKPTQQTNTQMTTHNYITELLEQITRHNKTIEQQQKRLQTQEQTILTLMHEINQAEQTTQQLLHQTQTLIDHIIQTKPPIPTQTLHKLQKLIHDTQSIPIYQHP